MSELLSELVPTNWCDPLLTGPDSIGKPPYNCRTIEKLLRGIQDRLREAEATRPAPTEGEVELAARRMARVSGPPWQTQIELARAALGARGS